mmetsp:Transcript_16923/g.28659  ORF Transcript_16923/g.28659 Transcript_16923/m.28659 type:complete len:291 (+) Transcript_16923:114-986(+)
MNSIKEKKDSFRNDYRIGQSIGTGSCGEVRKCRNVKTNLVKAVKILRKDKMDQNDYERFINEIQILNVLDHPNILKMFEFYEDEKRLYLVSDLCTGGELYDEIVARKFLDEKTASQITGQILSAVDYFHKKGIVHRDIKPENILLDSKRSNNIKLVDFRAAVVLNQDSSQDMIKSIYGTPYYVAPEVLFSEYDEKCDIWSVGIILYLLLTGKPPFNGKDDKEIVKKVRKGYFEMDIPEMEAVSPEAQDLVKLLLDNNPVRRLCAHEALNHPWIKKYNYDEQDNILMHVVL